MPNPSAYWAHIAREEVLLSRYGLAQPPNTMELLTLIDALGYRIESLERRCGLAPGRDAAPATIEALGGDPWHHTSYHPR